MALPSWIVRLRGERAQTMAEYAVILGVITPVIVVAYTFFSDDIGRLLNSVRSIFGA